MTINFKVFIKFILIFADCYKFILIFYSFFKTISSIVLLLTFLYEKYIMYRWYCLFFVRLIIDSSVSIKTHFNVYLLHILTFFSLHKVCIVECLLLWYPVWDYICCHHVSLGTLFVLGCPIARWCIGDEPMFLCVVCQLGVVGRNDYAF